MNINFIIFKCPPLNFLYSEVYFVSLLYLLQLSFDECLHGIFFHFFKPICVFEYNSIWYDFFYLVVEYLPFVEVFNLSTINVIIDRVVFTPATVFFVFYVQCSFCSSVPPLLPSFVLNRKLHLHNLNFLCSYIHSILFEFFPQWLLQGLYYASL